MHVDELNMLSAVFQSRFIIFVASILVFLIICWYWNGWTAEKASPFKLLRLAALILSVGSIVLMEKHLFRLMTGRSLSDDVFSVMCVVSFLCFGAFYGFRLVASKKRKSGKTGEKTGDRPR
jgi:hypothetical protein